MKMTVITDSGGNIVGTAHFVGDKGAPNHARLHASPGYTLHELEVPEDLTRMKSAAELHEKLHEHLKLAHFEPNAVSKKYGGRSSNQ
jgi:hypothetical protein